jgi:Cysteine-rich secretory protein family
MAGTIRVACVALICAAPAWLAPARAEDMAAMISQYRREHGLRAVRTDPSLTAVAERQARAMAAAGVLDHGVAGAFASRISGVNTDSAGENIAAGTKTWSDTLRVWKASPGHNENLLRSDADTVGVAVAYNNNTRFKAYWAMVIAHKAPATQTAGGRVRLSSNFMQAAAINPDASPDATWASAPSHPRRKSKADNSPGLFDSLGTAFKRATTSIRSLWN